MKRTVGLLPLTFIASGGILGSGWLFSPQLTAQLAGPAALIAWGVATVAMLLLANAYAEVAGILPVPGGIARVPRSLRERTRSSRGSNSLCPSS